MTVSAERGRRSAPPRARAGSLLMHAGVLGLFLVVIAATALAGRPVVTGGILDFAPRQAPTAPQTLTAAPSPPPPEPSEPNPVIIIIGIALLVFVAVVVIIVLVRLIRALIAALRHRMRALPDPAGTEVEAAIEPAHQETVDAPTVLRGIAAALSAVTKRRDPGDAIVAAWLGLEETASDAGAGRGRAETPAEFTLRILLTRPGIDEPAQRLLNLYEQVRFGGHQPTEAMRDDAARTLAEIERGWR
ncbi:DUF4129 domain-containing protein [Microbacterium sp. nov. GSS16]|uniref:DUF4129 domain-containing protein n=1 Tax=Microbacterium sp. nov. GSS16 TaxID=3019890 RepID=UPI0023067066|nr:DUF4129 domain-containing protein [Microbacterium sp. nov. GSS16]WCD91895.1 DUF4129 domain-containing protein [Microbacterium sp. nov. GSS16]